MKQSIYLLSIFLFFACSSQQEKKSDSGDSSKISPPDPAHTSRNSLDWQGTYTGMLPCEDCPGIFTRVTLNDDGTYQLMENQLGKTGNTLVSDGELQWNDQGNSILLSGSDVTYFVGENTLFATDGEGNRMTEAGYQLQKNPTGVQNRYWELVQLRGKNITTGKRQPFLLLMSDTTRVFGHTGCNGMNGTYTMEGLRLSFSGMASTMMACPDVAYEREFLDILNMVDNYTMSSSGDTLSLNKARMAPLAVFKSGFPE